MQNEIFVPSTWNMTVVKSIIRIVFRAYSTMKEPIIMTLELGMGWDHIIAHSIRQTWQWIAGDSELLTTIKFIRDDETGTSELRCAKHLIILAITMAKDNFICRRKSTNKPLLTEPTKE